MNEALEVIKGELPALKMMVGIHVIALNMAIIGLIVNTIITEYLLWESKLA